MHGSRPIQETATCELPDTLPYEGEVGRKATVGMLGFGPKGERERKMGQEKGWAGGQVLLSPKKKTGRRKRRKKREKEIR